MQKKLRAGVIGATGMVGQRFISLLADHPWFDVTVVAASSRSAGKNYAEAVGSRWAFDWPIPSKIAQLVVQDAALVDQISSQVDFVFCAVDMSKEEVRALEDAYAKAETPVVSNNSAHRGTPDVPMIIPEINDHHLAVIAAQKERLGTKRGFVVVKPNCSIQSYVPALHALAKYQPTRVVACTYQAISGAGKTFATWPEMVDNVIPLIKGEEEKSEQEPLKVWGEVVDGQIVNATTPAITTQCVRVPVSDGHLAAVFVSFAKKPSEQEIFEAWQTYQGKPQVYGLPSAPVPFLKYFAEADRPQTKLDRDAGNGMGVTIGLLRPDSQFDYKFVCLSHNTLRGAAGGAVLTAELLVREGYIIAK